MNPLNSTVLAPLRAWAERLLGHWRGSLAQRLWHLWLSELHGVLPARWRERLGSGPQVRYLAWPLDTPMGSSAVQPAAGARHVLLLATHTVLIQHLAVPLIATRNLRDVLGFELDKHTPFNLSQLYFDARVISRDKRQAQVVLVAILRERLQVILDQCEQQGLIVQGVDVCDTQGVPLGIDLLPSHAQPQKRAGNRLDRWLLAICAALLLGCMLLWLNARQTLLDDMQNTVAEQRQQVHQLQRLRGELLNTRGAARYLAQHKLAQPALAQVLADLTDCLGADTWLEQLEVSDSGEVTLSGQSASASDLIKRIKSCHSLVDAQFQGIIQPDADTGKDRFSLRAHLRKEAADAPSA